MQKFNLDISIKRVIPLLYVKQRDVGTKILVNITNNGDAYAIPAGASLSVWYSGSSGEGNYTTIGENSAFSIDGNTVTVELIMQMLNNPGDGKMCLVMNGADGLQLGLWDIPYFVEAIPGADSEAAQVYYSAFQEHATKAVDAADRASAAAEALEGGLVLQKGEGVDSIVQISTTGTDNKSYAPAGTALGKNTVSGIKGFHMVSVDTENLLITVDDAELEEKAAEKYTVGDELQFDAKNHNYFSLEIVSLATNDAGQSVIGVKQTTEETLNLTLDADPNENYCWAAGKNYGEIFLVARASHSEGEGTIAAGRCTHAEGRDTKAVGNYGHAEGRDTVAGYIAHAEGRKTTASGDYSHAEGYETASKGVYSHAEGLKTTSTGKYSHAEGTETQAIGIYSHTEGKLTRAEGPGAHAEGYASIAKGGNSHAEGNSTEAICSFAHAEGYNTIAGDYVKDDNGNYLDASGEATTDPSKYVIDMEKYAQHAEGTNTKALGAFSHAEGRTTIAEGGNAHSEGHDTHAKGVNSHAEGLRTKAEASASHAEGCDTRAVGVYTHAEGLGTIAAGAYQHVQGKYNVEDTEKKYAHIVGGGTSDTYRKNIHTIDWQGNAEFTGDHITVGGATLTAATIKLLEGLTVSEGVAF